MDPEVGFTSDVIRDPRRFVGRTALIQDSIAALNSSQGLIAIYGKRGVGKSSLMRQIQALATGNYELVRKAGLAHLIPSRPRKYYTVYYACDSMIKDASELIKRLCNDTDPEDGLLRLVPDQGKQLSEFSRTNEDQVGLDLKLLKWGNKGQDAQKYSSCVPGDLIQTFRNFVSSIVESNNRLFSKRDSVLILIDEFDVIKDKTGLGSLIKSLTSDKVKFGICGIGKDLGALITDHQSVARLIEQGSVNVRQMSPQETASIFETASLLSGGLLKFTISAVERIADLSEGYPYFAQLMGKACVTEANFRGTNNIDDIVLEAVLDKIRTGRAFPNLESQYQNAIGSSDDRALLLTLFAEQSRDTTEYDASIGRVILKQSRSAALDLGIDYIDQLVPRLIEERYGPVLEKVPGTRGSYEFTDPVFRCYVKLRKVGN
ncbi:MAG: AAA family ATPase [Methylovirgula sp.]|nr:AAA family ATPase [Methylovirgula sp.]